MPSSNSPYTAFAALLSSSGHPVSPAELHGLLLGRSCAGADFDHAASLDIRYYEVLPAPPLRAQRLERRAAPQSSDNPFFYNVQAIVEPQDNVRQALIGLQDMVKGELTGDDIAVVLLLPGDDAPLSERAVALGQWCQGFLGGFGMTARDGALSAEAMEVLQDLAAIAQVQSALEESEDGENDYMEVMEYLRVAPLLLFTECAKPVPAAPKPSLH